MARTKVCLEGVRRAVGVKLPHTSMEIPPQTKCEKSLDGDIKFRNELGENFWHKFAL